MLSFLLKIYLYGVGHIWGRTLLRGGACSTHWLSWMLKEADCWTIGLCRKTLDLIKHIPCLHRLIACATQSHNLSQYFQKKFYGSWNIDNLNLLFAQIQYNWWLARSLLQNFFQQLIFWTKPLSFQPCPLHFSPLGPSEPESTIGQSSSQWNKKLINNNNFSHPRSFLFVHSVELKVAEDFRIHLVPKKT